MKKIIPFLISIILILNCNAHITSDPCNFKFILSDDAGIGMPPLIGIAITVNGVDYGFVNLPWGTAYAEEIVALPSGEVQMVWHGGFPSRYHIEIYNASNELIYTSPDYISGLFFTYQNECPDDIECLPIKDLEGAYHPDIKQVNLTWIAPESADLLGFDIFRNDSLINHLPPTIISYSDSTDNLENGNYTYCVIPIYPYECDLEDECREVPINVGIKNYEDNIMIFPNPANKIANISGVDVANIKVFNNMGQLILTQSNTNEINVSELTNGIYILSIETLTGDITQRKIIINH
jgi:hypothetical protein